MAYDVTSSGSVAYVLFDFRGFERVSEMTLTVAAEEPQCNLGFRSVVAFGANPPCLACCYAIVFKILSYEAINLLLLTLVLPVHDPVY